MRLSPQVTFLMNNGLTCFENVKAFEVFVMPHKGDVILNVKSELLSSVLTEIVQLFALMFIEVENACGKVSPYTLGRNNTKLINNR